MLATTLQVCLQQGVEAQGQKLLFLRVGSRENNCGRVESKRLPGLVSRQTAAHVFRFDCHAAEGRTGASSRPPEPGCCELAEVASEGEVATTAGTDGSADEGGGKADALGRTRRRVDKNMCCADIEACSTASEDEAPVACGRRHELLSGSELVEEAVNP